jgi:hypothetical protein
MDKDFGRQIKFKPVGAVNIVAAGTGDNSAVTGQSIDRCAANGRRYEACRLGIEFKAVLAAAATLSVAVELQESSDNSNWDTAEALQASTVAATGPGGGGTVHGVLEFPVQLSGRKQYIRFNFTPDLSAGSVDTAVLGACAAMGGCDRLPTT